MSKLQNWAMSKYAAIASRDEEGQGLAEYGLILALIAVVCAAAVGVLGGTINDTLGDINTAF